MFRALFRLVILLIVLVAVGGFFLGWWGAGVTMPSRETVGTAGRTGTEQLLCSIRHGGAALSLNRPEARNALSPEMTPALERTIAACDADDTVKALDLNVDTVNSVVTVTGKVRTRAERERALALARETNGVRRVVDHITIE